MINGVWATGAPWKAYYSLIINDVWATRAPSKSLLLPNYFWNQDKAKNVSLIHNLNLGTSCQKTTSIQIVGGLKSIQKFQDPYDCDTAPTALAIKLQTEMYKGRFDISKTAKNHKSSLRNSTLTFYAMWWWVMYHIAVNWCINCSFYNQRKINWTA